MAKKNDPLETTQEAPSAEVEPTLTLEERAIVALESLAESTRRLADKLAPDVERPPAIRGLGAYKMCPVGHAMQPSEEYCQHCYREKRAKKPAAASSDAV